MKKLLFILSIGFLLSGCSVEFGSPTVPAITNYETRSLVYGWLDNSDVEAKTLHQVGLNEISDNCKNPLLCKFNIRVLNFKNGSLYYSEKINNGLYKVACASGSQGFNAFSLSYGSPVGYDFGKESPIRKLNIQKPGVYYFGAHKMTKKRTLGDLIGRGKFEVIPAISAPTQRELLEAILINMQENNQSPVMIIRVQDELKKVKS